MIETIKSASCNIFCVVKYVSLKYVHESMTVAVAGRCSPRMRLLLYADLKIQS